MNCRKEVNYTVEIIDEERSIRGIKYYFKRNVAKCSDCNSYIFVDEIEDENEERFDEMYRKMQNRITINEIKKILMIYNIDKRPLSKLLGFGELTISRYLEGQLPRLEYSDMLRKILNDKSYMEECLEKGKKNITELAYRKVKIELERMKNFDSNQSKIMEAAIYIVRSSYEITNLSLQKILYFVQACSLIFEKKSIFNSQCEAWIHGPVYPEIYEKFKEFGRNQIEYLNDCSGNWNLLCDDELAVIDKVLKVFGIYNGKFLEELTHKEMPWINARSGYKDDQICNEVISLESITAYFEGVKNQYCLEEISQMKNYIDIMMK